MSCTESFYLIQIGIFKTSRILLVNIKWQTSESVRHDTHRMVFQYIQKHNDICILQCCLYSWEHRSRFLYKGKS